MYRYEVSNSSAGLSVIIIIVGLRHYTSYLQDNDQETCITVNTFYNIPNVVSALYIPYGISD